MHRGMGSAGGSQGSGSRVLPGKRMPGNMGNERVTVKNLKVMKVDEVNGVVVVSGTLASCMDNRNTLTNCLGCVPGPKNQIIRVQDAISKPWPAGPYKNADIIPASEVSTSAEAVSATV